MAYIPEKSLHMQMLTQRRVPKLYLETTVFNFFFFGKDGKKQQDTHMLFEAIKKGKYEVFSSQLVYDEIAKDKSNRKNNMKELVDKYILNILDYDKKVYELADKYVKSGIMPVKYIRDAWHIATATVNRLDFVVSFNMNHIVKHKTMIGTGFTNLQYGYRQIGLCTPTEVVEYGQK